MEKHILVVNDAPFQLSLLRGILERRGYRVSCFDGPEHALRAMAEAPPPDLIITDLHMPEIDGWRFCRLLRSPIYPHLNKVPILANSATYSGEDTLLITRAAGANAFLESPFRSEDLLRFVEDLIAGNIPDLKTSVLIVEEHPERRGTLRMALERHGYAVATADNIEQGSIELGSTAPDVVLLRDDAVSSGIDLAAHLASFPKTAFVVITGDRSPEGVLSLVRQGVAACVMEDFDEQELVTLIAGAHREKSMLSIEGLLDLRTRELMAEKDALRRSEARFHKLIQHSNDVLVIVDEAGIERYVSESVERVTGFVPEEIIGRSAFDFLHPEDTERVMKLFYSLLGQPGQTVQGEYRHLHKDGGWVELEALATNWVHEDEINGIVMNVRDVTERKKAEQEKARLEQQLTQAMKMEAVGRLAGGVAHDFNNLLTGISGNIQLALLDISADDPLAATLMEVNRAADSAASLTRQLLAFSRKQIIEPVVFDLNEKIDDAYKMLRRLIGENIHVVVEPFNGPLRVKMDPGQLEQVLMNLAVNSRDAMPDGGLLKIKTKTCQVGEDDRLAESELLPGNYAVVEVTDQGIGMDDEVKSHLFEPFFTTKDVGQGTGLGLATVYGVVKQALGTVEVESEPGRGATFRVYLPCAVTQTQAPSRSYEPDIPEGTETILLVEDESIVMDMATRVLRRQGYRVLPFIAAQKALDALKNWDEPLHLLVTDVVMPDMNGKLLADRVLEVRPDVKVLFTSGYTADIIGKHGVLEEGIEFLEKPYTPRKLASKVRAVLDG